MRGSVRLLTAAIAAVALTVTGCGGSEPAPAPVDEPTIDPGALDFGPYDPNPRDMGKPKNPEQAAIFEAERLGNYMPLPMDIDPAFVYNGMLQTLTFIDPKESLLRDFADLGHFAEDAPDLISGFVNYGKNDPDNYGIELVNAAMIFPSEQRATEVAAALERRDFATDPQMQAVAIPNYPQAHAHWVPTQQVIDVWYPVGRLVLYTSIYDQAKSYFNKVDLPDLVARATRSLDKVVPAVTKFTPTPPDKLMDQPVDIDGMLGRTMVRPQAAQGEWLNPPGVYTGLQGLAFDSDPADTRKWWEAVGVDRFADYGNLVIRTRDAAAAKDAVEELAGSAKKFKPAAAPKNLPIAQCREYTGPVQQAIRFYCAVNQGRYVGQSAAEQLLDAQQRISAQYAIFVKADKE